MLKLIDKALLGKVSESPGRNENEHRGSLVRYNPKAEPLGDWRKQHRAVETWLIGSVSQSPNHVKRVTKYPIKQVETGKFTILQKRQNDHFVSLLQACMKT